MFASNALAAGVTLFELEPPDETRAGESRPEDRQQPEGCATARSRRGIPRAARAIEALDATPRRLDVRLVFPVCAAPSST